MYVCVYVNLLDVIIFLLQILLVFYFVELLQQAYLAKKQDLCKRAAAVSQLRLHVLVEVLLL